MTKRKTTSINGAHPLPSRPAKVTAWLTVLGAQRLEPSSAWQAFTLLWPALWTGVSGVSGGGLVGHGSDGAADTLDGGNVGCGAAGGCGGSGGAVGGAGGDGGWNGLGGCPGGCNGTGGAGGVAGLGGRSGGCGGAAGGDGCRRGGAFNSSTDKISTPSKDERLPVSVASKEAVAA